MLMVSLECWLHEIDREIEELTIKGLDLVALSRVSTLEQRRVEIDRLMKGKTVYDHRAYNRHSVKTEEDGEWSVFFESHHGCTGFVCNNANQEDKKKGKRGCEWMGDRGSEEEARALLLKCIADF